MGRAFKNGFSRDRIESELSDQHRELMLDLILTWGTLDGVLGIMVAAISGEKMTDAANEYGKIRGTAKFQKILDALKSKGATKEVLKAVNRHKKSYKKFSKPRNTIAHGHCAGFSKDDPDYVIFAKFEAVGADGLAMDAVPLDEMRRALRWGRAFRTLGLKVADSFSE